jgi:hypothetical protein
MQNGSGYQGFNDMIDGGGMGQSGQSFDGGGLLSMIANMIASPRGTANAATGRASISAAYATATVSQHTATKRNAAYGIARRWNPQRQRRFAQ